MRKESLMFGVLGLVAGLVIGFVGANSMNRSAATPTPVATTMPGPAASGNPALPADHPPLGTSAGGDPTQAAPRPEVTAAIEKARTEPNDYEAQMTAADLYYQIQRFDDAAKLYEVATKLKPGETEPMIKLGNSYFDAEKYTEAEKWYLRALEKEPKNINVRTDLGLTYFLREPRDMERAIKEYKASLAIDPNHEITLQNLFLAYQENGDQESLRSTLDKIKTINPNNPVVLKDGGQ